MPSLYDSPATFLILLLNVFISGYALFSDPLVIDRFALKPRRLIANKEYYRLLSAGFVHAGIGHLAFNMMTLFFFGPVIEQILGTARFALLYFGSEFAAHGLSVAMHRHDPGYSAVGASGAISGVLFGYCLFYPLQKIYIFLIPIGIPAFLFAIGYVAVSVFAMHRDRKGGDTGGIAHEAHLGGAIAGLVLTILMEPSAISRFLSNFNF